jgi:XisH protein
MPVRDFYHDAVKSSLIKDCWMISADPYKIDLYANLEGDQPMAAERQVQKIIVEIKSFVGRSLMTDFYQAVGQYMMYRMLTPDTVWFRILGRGKVQHEAIDEIEALPANSPYRDETLKLFVKLKVTVENRNDREQNETELMMRLADSPLFTEYMERTVKNSYQGVVESFLIKRFGSLDEDLAKVVPNITKLLPQEFTLLMVDLSREELIDRFSNND